ncbi:MAG TPA: chorismate mutase [Firmicutes bacterium]|nr:chorismate mutase [Bacillota bacterium]
MELSEIRAEIDRIDQELTALLCRRMDCSLRVAEYKAAHRLPVLNEAREQAVLRHVRELGDGCREGYGDAAALVFSTMMDASRALQHQRLEAGRALRARLEGAKRALLPADTARVVCQGVPGAYSDEAAGRLFPGASPRFVPAFSDVFAAVADGTADYGVLPVENSTAGSVNEVYDLVMKRRFSIAAAVEVPVRHCLLALPGVKAAALSAVYSKQEALAQCAEYIAAHGLEARAFSNTAAAAEMVARSGDGAIAAIASRRAAEIYKLDIIDEDIQTADNNATRFIAISRELVIPADANKISLIFALPHVTGSLYRVLSRFAMAGLNLTKLESRPRRGSGFEYNFYLDFEGALSHPGTVDLLCALSEELPAFSFLGNYREQERPARG